MSKTKVKLRKLEKAQTLYGYAGPMNSEDVLIHSWNEYFAEGGELNRPPWMDDQKFRNLRSQYTKLANLHRPLV